MSKQDRQGVRTPSDLERKYNFGLISGKGAEERNKQAEQLNQLIQTVAQFMAVTNGKLETLEHSNRTWFYSGVPTLENQPAVEWTTDEVKAKHKGDFYYDEDNGNMYLFKKTGEVYEWVNC